MINNYLEKYFYNIEKGSKQLSLLPNDVKLRINMIIQMDTDFFIAKNKAIYAVSNTIKDTYPERYTIGFKKDFYRDKQK